MTGVRADAARAGGLRARRRRAPARRGSATRGRRHRRGRSSAGSAATSAPGSRPSWNIFDPEMVVIGGGFGVAGFDWLLEPALEVAAARRADAGVGAGPRRAGAARHDGGAGRRGPRSRSRRRTMPLAVCATPIGNLEDVTLRVLRELREADLVLCEDTRRTRVLLDRHGIQGAHLLSYHRHNEARRTAEVLPRLLEGARVALASDAGLPGVSDPGTRLIAAALEAGVPVTVLPGADGRSHGARRQRVHRASAGSSSATCRAASGRSRRCGAGSRRWPDAIVAYESPQRLPTALAALARRVARAAGRRLPRADEGVRGGRARAGRRGRRALRRRRRRARSRSSSGRRHRDRPTRTRRSRRSRSSPPPGCRAGRRRRSSRA